MQIWVGNVDGNAPNNQISTFKEIKAWNVAHSSEPCCVFSILSHCLLSVKKRPHSKNDFKKKRKKMKKVSVSSTINNVFETKLFKYGVSLLRHWQFQRCCLFLAVSLFQVYPYKFVSIYIETFRKTWNKTTDKRKTDAILWSSFAIIRKTYPNRKKDETLHKNERYFTNDAVLFEF